MKKLVFTVLIAGLAYQTASTQSLTYSSGQTVSPAFEGWEKNDDGSFNMLFGYMNRNWEEEPVVPIGPDNCIAPGPCDQGQPTRFQPRRNRFVFKVKVPKDWGNKELVWTLTVRGKTEKAYATLREDSTVDNIVQASENGALGAGISSPAIRANVAPDLTHFSGIVPCGIEAQHLGVTSMQDLGINVDMKEVDQVLRRNFEIYFGSTTDNPINY